MFLAIPLRLSVLFPRHFELTMKLNFVSRKGAEAQRKQTPAVSALLRETIHF
jgi:hypothetical protein